MIRLTLERARIPRPFSWVSVGRRGKGLAALAAQIDLTCTYAVVADARELVGTAGAAVMEAAQPPCLKTFHVIVVAAFRIGTE